MKRVKELLGRIKTFVLFLARGREATYEDITRPLGEMQRRLVTFADEQHAHGVELRREADILREHACDADVAADKAERTAARICNLLEV